MQLGCVISGKNDGALSARLTAARRAGYRAVQIDLDSSAQPESIPGILEHCAREALEIAALGAYTNPLQADAEPSSGISTSQLCALIEALPPPPPSSPWRIVTWSGTLSGQLFTPHPGNQNPGAITELVAWTQNFLPLLEKAGAELLFKPNHAHVLFQAGTVDDFLAEIGSDAVGVALDSCGFLAPRNFHEREAIIEKALKILGAQIKLVHLRDARIENFKVVLCGPGQGQMGFAGMLKQLSNRCPGAPRLVEGVESELSLKRSREFIELQAKLAGV